MKNKIQIPMFRAKATIKIWDRFNYANEKANKLVNVDKLRSKYGFERVYETNAKVRNRYMRKWKLKYPNKDEYTYLSQPTQRFSINANGTFTSAYNEEIDSSMLEMSFDGKNWFSIESVKTMISEATGATNV